jgi:hypothetical protein
MQDTHIFKLIASDMPKSVYEEAYRALWAQSHYGSGYRGALETLNGTPLNSALLAMMHVVQNFKAKHKVQKMNFITLTDGESESLGVNYGVDAQNRGRKCVVDHMGFTIKQEFGYGNSQGNTKNILECFTKMDVRTLNYYINPDRYGLNLSTKAAQELKVEGVTVMDKDGGYDRRFFIRSNSDKMTGSLSSMDFDDDANSSKIAREFSKYATSKKNARTLASKFAEVIS